MSLANPRIGPKMLAAANYVAENPGCVTRACADYVNPHPQPWRNCALGYNIVARAVAADLIVAIPDPEHRGRSRLYPADDVYLDGVTRRRSSDDTVLGAVRV